MAETLADGYNGEKSYFGIATKRKYLENGGSFNATQTARVGMAVSQVAIYPIGEKPPTVEAAAQGDVSPEFRPGGFAPFLDAGNGAGCNSSGDAQYVNQWFSKK